MDTLTPERRSENMRRIRSHNTTPELEVRRFLHQKGLRYRLHANELPGKPDLAFPALKACVFVHGCFWHGCTKCIDGTRRVKSRSSYWKAKVLGNRRRDRTHARTLVRLGWTVYVIWECEVRKPAKLGAIAARLLRKRSFRRRKDLL